MPALDGLRALALILVIFNHWGFVNVVYDHLTRADKIVFGLITNLGWSGVDLFFVLSGFLITGILLDTRAAPSFFGNFYARRTLRIFPPYYLFLVVLFVAGGAIGGDGPKYHALLDHQAWYWLYAQNWATAFFGWPEFGVDHLWSLAIEEQFYLVWPLVVFFGGARRTLAIGLGLILLSPILRAVILSTHSALAPDLVYASTVTRLDPLAWGAVFAAALRIPELRPRVGRIAAMLMPAALVGVAVLIAINRKFTKVDPGSQIFGFALLACFYAGVIGFVVTRERGHVAARWLSVPWLRWIGKISYVAYIVHLPALWAATRLVQLDGSPRLQAFGQLAVGVAITFGAAFLSWHALEKPLLKVKNRVAPSLAGATT